jgi:hypothetical protein
MMLFVTTHRILFLRGNRAGTKNVKTRNRKRQKIKKGEQHEHNQINRSVLGCSRKMSSSFRVVMSVTISAHKRCLVHRYSQLFLGGLMS